MIVKFTKYTGMERILKATRGNIVFNLQGKTDQVHSRSVHRNLAGDIRVAGYIQWHECEKYVARIFYPVILSFKIKGEIRSFPDKQKLKEFVTTKPAQQEILMETLWGQKKKGTNTGKYQRTLP